MQGIDHIVIAVRDLAAASDDYARLGFTVTPGGEHTGGATHNALISFADGAYFELIAFKEPDRPQDHKWWAKQAKGEGTVDFALRSESVTIVNSLGSGLLETRAFLAFLPAICRRLLNEDLRLPSVATWWCGQKEEREHVIANLDRMVIGPAYSRLPFFDDRDQALAHH